MGVNEFVEFSGKSLENVISDACKHFNASSHNEIEYEIVDMGSSGFLGFNSRPTRIRAKLKEVPVEKKIEEEIVVEEKKEETVRKEEPKKPRYEERANKKDRAEKKEELNSHKKEVQEEKPAELEKNDAGQDEEREIIKEDPEIVIGRVRTFLDDMFKVIGMDVKCDFKFNEERSSLNVELEGDDMGILIGKRGITLDSLQYLVSLVANKGKGEYVRVKVDTENYRYRRQKTLENLAKNLAYKVKRTKRSVSLEPMNPFERRIIHSALQGDRYVTTHSEGDEPYRRVVITLKRF